MAIYTKMADGDVYYSDVASQIHSSHMYDVYCSYSTLVHTLGSNKLDTSSSIVVYFYIRVLYICMYTLGAP